MKLSPGLSFFFFLSFFDLIVLLLLLYYFFVVVVVCNKILEILFIYFFLLLSVVGLSLFFSLRVVSLFNRSPSEAPFYCRGISNESLMV